MANAMEALKNRTAVPPAATPAAQGAESGPAQMVVELQRIATDDNSKATPQTNAVDIDMLAYSLMMVTQIVVDLTNEVVRQAEQLRALAPAEATAEATPTVPEVPAPTTAPEVTPPVTPTV